MIQGQRTWAELKEPRKNSLWGSRKSPMRAIEKRANKTDNPDIALERIKDTWENGEPVGRCRMGEYYIVEICDGVPGKILSIEDIVWAYKNITTINRVQTPSSLFVHYSNGKGDFINLSDDSIDAILRHFEQRHQDVVLGSHQEVEKMYLNKDYAGMKEFARQQRAGTI